MKKKFDGKVAVISGGDSGIGFAISSQLVKLGVRVYDVSLKTHHNSIFQQSFDCDISDDVAVKEVVNQIVAKEGKIDFLFCNAGFGIGGKVENADIELIDKILNVNLIAHIKMTKLFIPFINEGGKIIYTGSLASIVPLPYQACYSASKAGIEIFARALATELRSEKISVTTVMPCDVNTNFTAARIKSTSEDKFEKRGIQKMEESERKGATADYVAKRVVGVVKKKRPPLRVSIGYVFPLVSGGFISFLIRIFPTKVVNFLVRILYV